MEKKILVVDDFESIRDFVSENLSRKGYQTLTAKNGTDALQLLGKEQIDLVISDYNMPGVNGYELLKKIKNNDKFSKIPVIFLTSEKNPQNKRAAKDAGLYAWITKPYKTDVFISNIESALVDG